MTLAYVFNGLVTYAFWWEKPEHIVTASFVNLPEMISLQLDKFESLVMEIHVIKEDFETIAEWDANLSMTRYWSLLSLLGASFRAIPLILWISSFPSEAERWTSALVSIATSVVCIQYRKMILKWEGFDDHKGWKSAALS
ncbi:hypothetical protein DER45DRAFT_266010 [Fusarium avenaceum]|nr:hypothetical protein DER45DRAFT_266010 [Fusarium avenaceum]